MTEPILIGTRGWQHDVWAGGFYPEELPADWQFCFYSNNLRSVLVPGETWESVTRPDATQWMDDSDPAFRFVLELPAMLAGPQAHAKRDRALDLFFEVVEPIATRTAGWVLRLAPDTPVFLDWFEHLLNQLAGEIPLCVDLPAPAWRAPEVLAAVERQGAGVLWHCADDTAPCPGGRLLTALAPAADARRVRHWLEQLSQWAGHGHDARAALFFEADVQSAKSAQEARLIAELMGV